MTKILMFQLILISSMLFLISCQQCLPANEQFLITFHPHLDAFWLNTDTQLKDINFVPQNFLYAMNQRNSKVILNSMLQALSKNKIRKYFITEVVFFKDWYEYLKPEDQKKVKDFLKSGQLQISNGGWVQNDEAICYFDDILDQYTTGLNYLHQTFNYETKIGWATDSFGHSHSQVALQHLLGFQFQAIQRIDDRYIYQRKQKSLLEFYWSPISDSNNQKYGGVVTYVRHFLHQVNDLRYKNINEIGRDFVDVLKTMKTLYYKPKFFRFLGNDFQEFITSQFQNLEKTFSVLNQGNNNVCPVYKYGNPNDYLNLIKSQYDQKNIPVRAHDFMPNWDQDHYWNGYYTTDPDLKKICKDFSRLLNLFRKIAVKSHNLNVSKSSKIMDTANELLAVMQHHDGITATSKKWIQTEMKNRMKVKSMEIIKNIQQIKHIANQHCNLYQNNNKCKINTHEQTVYFSVFHQGTPKTEKIQLILPTNIYYSLQGVQHWQIFCISKLSICTLIFQLTVTSGQNILILKRVEQEKIKNKIISISKAQALNFSTKDIKLSVKGSQIDYVFNTNQYFKISLVKSNEDGSTADSMAWDKYGTKTNKQQRRAAGIYIMANSGQVTEIPQGIYKQLHAASGNIFTQIYLFSKLNTLTITIKNHQYNIIEMSNQFQPPNLQMNDYFIMVESSINPKEQFYHDMNGYLVMKRKLGFRPDYQWQYKPIDKIAANTYPLCSFAYAIENDKKFVISVDRAAGVSLYNKAFILNIDRLSGDDYKGVGEGYSYKIKNTFVQKIGLVNKNDFIERKWQKQYDQPLIAFYSIAKRDPQNKVISNHKQADQFLKYTVFNLNKDEIVIRLMNLNEKANMALKKFSKNLWTIDQLGINLGYKEVKESFAHGVPKSQRKLWKTIDKEINILTSNKLDNSTHIILKPLQIRSFRIFINTNIQKTLLKSINNQPLNNKSSPQQLPSKKIPSSGKSAQASAKLTKPTQLTSPIKEQPNKAGVVKFKRRCF